MLPRFFFKPPLYFQDPCQWFVVCERRTPREQVLLLTCVGFLPLMRLCLKGLYTVHENRSYTQSDEQYSEENLNAPPSVY